MGHYVRKEGLLCKNGRKAIYEKFKSPSLIVTVKLPLLFDLINAVVF